MQYDGRVSSRSQEAGMSTDDAGGDGGGVNHSVDWLVTLIEYPVRAFRRQVTIHSQFE